ncbi:MAG: zinc ribbon domain-containing protein [Bacteroidales bacterium]|nr:zinc ribbon domain-containing protein [Bacteroidales bacterium]
MNFCPKCGYQLKPEASFCGSCGENINPIQQTTTAEMFQSSVSDQLSPKLKVSDQDFNMKNSQRQIVNLWLILLAVFIFCIFLPSIIGLDGFDGGFAMSFTSGFMVIMSLVVIFIYRSRAKQLGKILKGEGRIAVWNYSQDEWIRFIAADFEDEKKSKKMLFFIVAVIAVVVGIILMISLKDVLALFIALGIIPIVAIPAFWAPRARFNKLKNSEPKALISEKGVIVGKMFHLWVNLGASLDKVMLSIEENPEMIEFTYSMPTRNGRDVQVARVPVPKGKHYDAEKIIDYFNSQV